MPTVLTTSRKTVHLRTQPNTKCLCFNVPKGKIKLKQNAPTNRKTFAKAKKLTSCFSGTILKKTKRMRGRRHFLRQIF